MALPSTSAAAPAPATAGTNWNPRSGSGRCDGLCRVSLHWSVVR